MHNFFCCSLCIIKYGHHPGPWYCNSSLPYMLVGVDATGETICQPMCVDSQSQSLERDDFGTSADQCQAFDVCVVLTDQ